MFSALSSSSCFATSLARCAGSTLGALRALEAAALGWAEAGAESALLPDLELRREGRVLSFGIVDVRLGR
jgi:hypothetical protein